MSARIITDKDQWDKFVDNSPYGLLFHKWDFLKIVEKHSGFTLLPYGAYKGSELICIFPVFMKKRMGMTLVFSPPPRTGVPYLGFVMSPMYDRVRQRRRESYLNGAIEDIREEINKLSPNYISIITVPGFDDIRPFQWSGYTSGMNYTYTFDLKQRLEEIWKGFDDNCRKNIKQCEGQRLEIKESRDTHEFFRIMCDRYAQQKLNYPVLSAEYLSELIAAFPDNLKMYYLCQDEKTIGIELVCQYKGNMMLWMGESLIQKDIPANYYLRWEFIRKAKAEGFEQFEIQGANTRHLCANKSRFNPELTPGFFVYKKDALGSLAEWTYQNLVKRKVFGH
jgi:hypothetical protein